MAELVVGARVGCVNRGFALFTAIGIVGERAIHAAFRMGINGYPFRAIHFCCAHRIGSKARFDQQIALIVETLALIKAIFTED
ncbi:Uncharacterised protein [Klebsiella pneumoniae]|nr:Uncharacterised protein [Klebsiella pneumoniae]